MPILTQEASRVNRARCFIADGVEMLFHHRQTQTGAISNLLVAPSFTNKSGNFLFAPGESDKMRQTRARRRGMRTSLTAQIFALDKKMGLRHAA